MSDVGLMGGATTPKPAIVVNFKSFALDPKNPHMSGIIVGGTRQHGQGDHGSLSRANTFNNMAAIGPDFKKRFVSQSPVEQRRRAADLGACHEDEDSEPRRAARARHHGSAGRRPCGHAICARRRALATVRQRVLDRVDVSGRRSADVSGRGVLHESRQVRVSRLGGAAALVVLWCTAASAQAPSVKPVRVLTPPAIDGRLDDSSWTGARTSPSSCSGGRSTARRRPSGPTCTSRTTASGCTSASTPTTPSRRSSAPTESIAIRSGTTIACR